MALNKNESAESFGPVKQQSVVDVEQRPGLATAMGMSTQKGF